MTEPHKIYISGCQEVPLYGDMAYSRHFTYKMNSFTKGKIRSLLIVLLCIFGFLLIAFLFIIIGILIYPKLIGHCKRQVSFEKQVNQINDHYIPSLGDVLSGIGMCKGLYNDILSERMEVNQSEIESFLKNVDAKFIIKYECKCPNSSQMLNTSENYTNRANYIQIRLIDNCILNQTNGEGDFVRNRGENKSKSYPPKLLNDLEVTSLQNIYTNETGTVDEISYLQPNACDCTNIQRLDNQSLNGKDSEKYYASLKENKKCNCSEMFGSNTELNDTASSKEANDGSETLETPAFNNSEVINESIKNAMQSVNAEEVHYVRNFRFNETNFANGNKNQIMDPLNAGETRDNLTLYFNETEAEIEKLSQIKENCTCPKTRNMTYELFNGTQLSDEAYNLAFKGEFTCECRKSRANDTFYKTKTKIEATDNTSFNIEECVCPEIAETVNNKSVIQGKKRGFRTNSGECMCPETQSRNTFSDTEITNGSEKYGKEPFSTTNLSQTIRFPSNEKESVNENYSSTNIKCICPKAHEFSDNVSNETSDGFNNFVFKENDSCVCQSTKDENISNFDLHEAETENDKIHNQSLKFQECVCHEDTISLENATLIPINKLSFKTENDSCLCLEILDLSVIHGNETETINEQEIIHESKKDSMSVKESVLGTETNFGVEIGTVNVKELSSERDSENKKESRYGDENGNSDYPLSFDEVTSAYDKHNISEKELSNDDEKGILNKQKMTRDDND